MIGTLLLSPVSGCSASSLRAQDAAAVPAGEAEQVLDELRQVYRTLYALSADEERAQILERLFSHRLAPMRAFGLDLARRTLLNARNVPADLLARADGLLGDEAPAVRRNAAQLIATLGGEAASRKLAETLAVEREPSVANEILRALTQSPGTVAIEQLYRWMAQDGEVGNSAFAVALAVSRSAELGLDVAQRTRVRELIGGFDPARSSAARIALAWRLGMDGYVDAALASGAGELRAAAATAMIQRPELLDRVLEASAADPSLFSIAVDGIVAHRPTGAGYREALTLPAGSDEIKRSGMRRVLVALGAADLVSIARGESDLFVRETMLRHLEDESFRARLDVPGDWAMALRELVSTRAKIGDCTGVVRAADLLDETHGGAPDARTSEDRLRCLLGLGQLERAEALTAAMLEVNNASIGSLADAWIAGLGQIGDDAARRSAGVEAARRLFAGGLTPAQSGRLDALGRPVQEAERVEGDAGGTIPPQ